MKKRLLSALLVLAMVLTLLPMTVLAAGASKFEDVKSGSWYYTYVDYVARNGYFEGVGNNKFDPEGTMTRAMFVTVLSRYADAKVDNSKSTFTDVPVGTWYTGAVTWANENKIVEGIGGGLFQPNEPVSRQDMATILDRFVTWYEKATGLKHVTPGTAKAFPDDASIAAYAKKAVAQCQVYGLIEGYDDGLFHPLNSSTRAQVAAVIYRLEFVKRTPSGGGSGTTTPPTSEEPVEKVKVTFDENYEGGSKTTQEVKKGTEVGKPTDPTRTGYIFLGWYTEDGTDNNWGDPVTFPVTVDDTVIYYAKWGYDYIHDAVKDTVKWFNDGPSTDIGNAWDKLKELVEEKLGDSIGETFEIGDVTYTYEDGDIIMSQGDRSIEVTINAETYSDTVVAIVRYTYNYIKAGGSDVTGTAAKAKAGLSTMLKDVLGELGVEVSAWDLSEIASELAEEYGEGFKKNFLNLDDGTTCVKDVTITIGDYYSGTLEAGGMTVDKLVTEAKAVAKALAQSMRDSAMEQTEWTGEDALELTAEVGLSFTPAESIADAYQVGENEGNEYYFPTDYTVVINVSANSDYLDYMYSGGHNIKVTIPEDVKTWYDGLKLDEQILNSKPVQNRLLAISNKFVETIEDEDDDVGSIYAMFGDVLGLFKEFGFDEDTGKAYIRVELYKWLEANKLTKTLDKDDSGNFMDENGEPKYIENSTIDFANSFVFDQLANGENATKTPINDNFYAFMDVVGEKALNQMGDMKDLLGAVQFTPENFTDQILYYINMMSKTQPDLVTKYERQISMVTKLNGYEKDEQYADLLPVLKYVYAYVIDSMSASNPYATDTHFHEQSYVAPNGGDNYYTAMTKVLDSKIDAGVDALIEGLKDDFALYQELLAYIERIKEFDGVWKENFGGIVTVLKHDAVKALLSEDKNAEGKTYFEQYKGTIGTYVDQILAVLDMLPSQVNNVSVQIDGAEKTASMSALKDELNAIKSAEDYDALVKAIDGVISGYGLTDLSLASFEEGVKMTATYGSSTFNFTLYLECEWAPITSADADTAA